MSENFLNAVKSLLRVFEVYPVTWTFFTHYDFFFSSCAKQNTTMGCRDVPWTVQNGFIAELRNEVVIHCYLYYYWQHAMVNWNHQKLEAINQFLACSFVMGCVLPVSCLGEILLFSLFTCIIRSSIRQFQCRFRVENWFSLDLLPTFGRIRRTVGLPFHVFPSSLLLYCDPSNGLPFPPYSPKQRTQMRV